MIKSMTGYGRSELNFQGATIVVELRSVNNRYLDCTARLPRLYLYMEDAIKSLVQKEITRGKVEVFVSLEDSFQHSTKIKVNHPLAKSYCDAFAELEKTYQLEHPLTAYELSRIPDILLVEQDSDSVEKVGEQILMALELALKDFGEMRRREGSVLTKDILTRCETIEALLKQIEEKSPITLLDYREKLEKRMNEVLSTVPVDSNRILIETAIFADKIAIDEETVRIHSHLNQFRLLLKQEGSIGRKLDFLIQEFNRETNTIGSKCNDVEISHWVVDLKAELEKIREQVQNIE